MICSSDNKVFEKDPDAKLWYKFDWAALTNGSGLSDWLEDGETIDSFTISPDAGITSLAEARSDGNTSVSVKLGGGEISNQYKVVCHIVTSLGNEDDRTMHILMVEK